MTSYSGYINYLTYVAGSNKGSVQQGDIFNGVFGMPQTHNEDALYTSSKVVENVEGGEIVFAWKPQEGSVRFLAEGSSEYVDLEAVEGVYTAPSAGKVAYTYNNEVIPQNDLPTLNVKMNSIALTAKARRIAVYYSQFAAFQAKQDYGFSLEDQIAAQAAGQLAYKKFVPLVA